MEKHRKTGELISKVPTRIPIPERLLRITDPQKRRESLEALWLSYGYNDRFEVERIEDGHIIMVPKHNQGVQQRVADVFLNLLYCL